MYGFNRQKTFRAKSMAGNSKSSKEHRRPNKKGMDQGGSLLAKHKWDKNYHVVFFRQEGQTSESTHFLSNKYKIVDLNIDSGFNHKL